MSGFFRNQIVNSNTVFLRPSSSVKLYSVRPSRPSRPSVPSPFWSNAKNPGQKSLKRSPSRLLRDLSVYTFP